ncbi:MAG TPA: hypothetical protein VHA13_01120, partial [Gammaproteobacteria bacterium]|nr:hypothetical protein [Gammaproteobacteria bacterium]
MQSGQQKKPDFSYIKNLTQVFLDGELGGTPFEGSRLNVTAPYLLNFLTWLKSPSAVSAKSVAMQPQQVIAHIAHGSFSNEKQLDRLLGLLNRLQFVIELEAKLGSNVLNLKDIASSIVSRFEKEKEVFMPGGWVNDSGGHQMIYRLKEGSDGKVIFQALNSGAGIEYHGMEVRPSGKPVYYPVFAFKFDLTGQREELAEWLAQLLKPLTALDKTCTAEKLYEQIIYSGIPWLRGKIIPGKDLASPILGQRDGTCVYKAMMLMVREHFNGEKSAYRQFVLAYRLYLLNEAVNPELSTAEKQFPGYVKILKASLANTVRMLDSNIKGTKVTLEKEIHDQVLNLFENLHVVLKGVSGNKNN